MGKRTLASLLVLLWVAAACAVPMTVPNGFSQLRERGPFQATTPDDAVLCVRDVVDPTVGADAKFWIDALRADFVGQRGYLEVGGGEIQDQAGVGGRWLECTANVRGEKVGYLVAVWMRRGGLFDSGDPYLQVVEFAAREPVYTARIEAVKKALATVRE